MGMEFFAEVARLLVPDWYVVAVEDVDFLVPVKFYRDEPRTLTGHRPDPARRRRAWSPTAASRRSGCCPGSETPQRTVHFTGSVRLGRRTAPATGRRRSRPARGSRRDRPPTTSTGCTSTAPPTRSSARAGSDDGAAVGRFAEPTCRPTTGRPTRPTTLGPRLVELCFQAAGLWEAGRDRSARPAGARRPAERLVGRRTREEPGRWRSPGRRDGQATRRLRLHRCSIADGRVLLRLEGYRTVAMPGTVAEDVRAPLPAVLT